MDKQKKRRLEAAGWKFGNAEDFLESISRSPIFDSYRSLKYWLDDHFGYDYYPAKFLLWLLRKIYRCKNESLNRLIHDVADQYARKPEGKWS